MAGFPEDLDGLVPRSQLPQEALSKQQWGSLVPAVMGHHLAEVWGHSCNHPLPALAGERREEPPEMGGSCPHVVSHRLSINGLLREANL